MLILHNLLNKTMDYNNTFVNALPGLYPQCHHGVLQLEGSQINLVLHYAHKYS